MSKSKRTITIEVVKSLKPGEIVWDTKVIGFGVRRQRSKARTYILKSKVARRQRWFVIGRHGSPWTPEKARSHALQLLGGIAGGTDIAALRDHDKSKLDPTLKEFCEDYLQDAKDGKVTYRGKPKKASTLSVDDGRINRHIIPLLGKKTVREITTDDVTSFMHAVRLGKTAVTVKTGPRGVARVRGGDTAAARAVGLLGSIMTYAIKRKLREDNPVRGVVKPSDRHRTKTLNPAEYKRFGKALDKLLDDGANPYAIHAIRLLAVTGCRRNEVFSLRKNAVDTHHHCFRFEDTKGGEQVRPIGDAAIGVLADVPIQKGSDYVFPAAWGKGHIRDVKVLEKACSLAKLVGITAHALRHAFASVAGELNYSDAVIGVMLGHRSNTVTGRYTHIPDPAGRSAADLVSAAILRRMKGAIEDK
ncbi:MAG: tyrosine-type recombinase/integrase [Rhodospirillales bacterium]|nr:tyrosine-type recombinase/integrase [Rhodospirillales bacterium]